MWSLLGHLWKEPLGDPMVACGYELIFLSTFTTTQPSDPEETVQASWAMAFPFVWQKGVQLCPW